MIIIPARDSVDDKIAGFDFGTDDYLTKPFHLSELNTRVKALMRSEYTGGINLLEIGNLKVNQHYKNFLQISH